jgi:hypothetical protein
MCVLGIDKELQRIAGINFKRVAGSVVLEAMASVRRSQRYVD